MTVEQLATILHDNYFKADTNEMVYQIHVFGIRYADEIKRSKHSVARILQLAELPESYQGEIHKGMRLSNYYRFNDSEVTTESLGAELKFMYENAPENEMVTQIHRFAINNSPTIKRNGFPLKKILDASGIPKSYISELHKGVRLSNFVLDSVI